MTFLPDGHVAVAPGQRHAVAEAVTIWLSPAPIFFHVPDWHGG
ncbi:prepilin, shufflon protein A, partial [Escherichia coli]|nr:prepilin, shufflon protein A [Salmonella enterica]EBS5931304.1 prepilin, shufflon protein A [Salmonella enterica subsp. enterica serovar Saintpaul]EFF2371301.1 prepilin, shufflon protein A [Escherichia coli]EGD7501385.1 prepilin, shufflon protein A [Shigella sonnei]EDI8922073.1 prepilin, shufflon protein A [Salmonella enterica]